MTIERKVCRLLETGVLQAIADCRSVQQRPLTGGVDWHTWAGSVTILFDDSWEVRVKPKPKEFFINIIDEIPRFAYTQKELDKMVNKSQLNLIKVREVLE